MLFFPLHRVSSQSSEVKDLMQKKKLRSRLGISQRRLRCVSSKDPACPCGEEGAGCGLVLHKRFTVSGRCCQPPFLTKPDPDPASQKTWIVLHRLFHDNRESPWAYDQRRLFSVPRVFTVGSHRSVVLTVSDNFVTFPTRHVKRNVPVSPRLSAFTCHTPRRDLRAFCPGTLQTMSNVSAELRWASTKFFWLDASVQCVVGGSGGVHLPVAAEHPIEERCTREDVHAHH